MPPLTSAASLAHVDSAVGCAICGALGGNLGAVGEIEICSPCAIRLANATLEQPRLRLEQWWLLEPEPDLDEHFALLREHTEASDDTPFLYLLLARAFGEMPLRTQAILAACGALAGGPSKPKVFTEALGILFSEDAAGIARRIAQDFR